MVEYRMFSQSGAFVHVCVCMCVHPHVCVCACAYVSPCNCIRKGKGVSLVARTESNRSNVIPASVKSKSVQLHKTLHQMFTVVSIINNTIQMHLSEMYTLF